MTLEEIGRLAVEYYRAVARYDTAKAQHGRGSLSAPAPLDHDALRRDILQAQVVYLQAINQYELDLVDQQMAAMRAARREAA